MPEDDFMDMLCRPSGAEKPKHRHPKVVELIHLSGRDFVVKLDNGSEGVACLKAANDGTLFFGLPYCNAIVTMRQIRDCLQGEIL